MRITRLYSGTIALLLLLIACGGDSKQTADSSRLSPIDSTSLSQTVVTTRNYSVDTVPENMTMQEKKQRFNSLVLPIIEEVYDELMALYKEVGGMIDSGGDSLRLAQLRKKYRAPGNVALLQAIKPHPVSIALAQAAMDLGDTERGRLILRQIFAVYKDRPEVDLSSEVKVLLPCPALPRQSSVAGNTKPRSG